MIPTVLARLAFVAFVFASLIASAPSALAQFGPEPVFQQDPIAKQMPALNPVPSCDDGNTAIDGDQGSCSVANTPEIDLGEYSDTGDPVGLHNGMVSYRTTDLHIPGRGLDFTFTRRYSSGYGDVDGPLGRGWTHSYDVWIELLSNSAVVWNGNQRGDEYIGNTTSGFTAPRGVFSSLTWDGTRYTLRNRHGLKSVFEPFTPIQSGYFYARLVSITDRDGNSLTFTYGSGTYGIGTIPKGRSRLISVRDSMKRTITFVYEVNGRLQRVVDFAGRAVVFRYDGSNTLSTARSPQVLFACAMHRAPEGRTERYRYLDAGSHRLLSEIVKPNDGQNDPNAQAAVRFEYYTGPIAWAHRRCISQRLGEVGAPGPNEILYQYSTQSSDLYTPANPVEPEIPRIRTRVTDRKGNITDYFFNRFGHCVLVREHTGTGTFLETRTTYDLTVGGLSEGLIASVQYPRGNLTTYTYQTGGNRWADGNVISITQQTGTVSPSQPARVTTFLWEPVYQHICAVTDERGFTREFLCEWMEGSASDPTPNVITAVASELGLDYTSAQNLVGGALQGVDFNGDGRKTTGASGNLVKLVEPNVNLQPAPFTSHPQSNLEGSNTPSLQEAVTTWTYNSYGQRTSITDAEENVTVYLYWPETDPDGDGLNPTANADANTGGYVRRIVEDTAFPFSDPFVSPGQLDNVAKRVLASDIGRDSNINPKLTHRTSDYRYTRFGYQKELIDQRGVKHEYHRNAVGEIYRIVRAASVVDVAARAGGCDGAESLAGQDYAYDEFICHDFNGNVAERRIQNSGNNPDAGALAGYLESNYTYDILDNLLTEAHEHDASGGFEITSYEYDANENLERVIYPAGNDLRMAYDFRDLLHTTTRGHGTPDVSTTTRTYDNNGNLKTVTDGTGAHTTTFDYDGFDRVIEAIEPIGTRTTWAYDPASNVTDIVVNGALNGPSAPQPFPITTQLSSTKIHYDARSRAYRVDRLARAGETLVDGSLIPGDNAVTTRIEFDRLGRRTFVVEDDGQLSNVCYDGAHRPFKSFDAAGNMVEICWDDNSNPVLIREREVYPAPAVAKTYETYSHFDSLNRRTSVTNNLGETHRFQYDSRNNLVFTTDPQAALNGQTINNRAVNHPGNARRFRHDGLGRLVREEYDLYVGGQGGPAPVIDTSNPYNSDGVVRLLRGYDLNGRLTSRTDDKGNVTSYQYDTLNRVKRETLADTTFYEYVYGPDDVLTQVKDPNGTVVDMNYDANDRLTWVNVASVPAQPVLVGTTRLRFEYDGLGRRTYSKDIVDNVEDANDWIVTRAFDSLGRATTETQGPLGVHRTLTNSWREESKRTQVAYPSGLNVTTLFDALDRVASISANGNSIAAYTYAGPGRVLERVNGNGTIARFHDGSFNDAAHYDGARRPTRVEHVASGGALLTGFEHAYDRVGNRKFERRLHDGGKGDNYLYDSLYRLVTFERLVPAANVGAAGLPGANVVKSWKIDGVQNWRELITNGATTTTTVDSVNHYTSFGAATPVDDNNGNLIAPDFAGGPAVTLNYDFLNRLRRVTSANGGQLEHDYDAEGRRVRTRATNVPSMPAVSEFVFDGWEEIEEHVKASSGSAFALARRYVHGRSLDEPLRLENLAFYPSPGTYWFQQSTLGNVAALADSSGAIVERYTYDAYGLPQFETPANVAKAVASSDFGNPYLFQARRYEHALYPLYDFRARFLDPARGRFVQRDPPGTWHDALNLGGAMAFAGGRGPNATDPFGLEGGGWFDSFVEDVKELAGSAKEAASQAYEDAKEFVSELPERIANGGTAAVSGAATGSVTGAVGGAAVGVFAFGVGAVPAAAAGATGGAIAGAITGFITGVFMPVDSTTSDLLWEGAVQGGTAGLAGGGGAVVRGVNTGTLSGTGTAAGAPKTAPAGGRRPDVHPSTPTGRRGSPLNVPRGTNSPTTIGGRDFSGHAIDQMQCRGVMPSVVENAIQNGARTVGRDGTFEHVSDGVKVITNAAGRVVTVITQ